LETNEYLSMFIDESKEHLQALNDNMLNLENAPDDISIVQNIFRSAHTLKGMSATMGFEDLASLTHEMENVLDLVRNHKLKMSDFVFDAIFQSLDSLEAMVNDIIEGGTGKADVTDIVSSLQSIVSGDFKKGAKKATKSKEEGQALQLDEFQYSVLEQSIETGFNVFYIEVSIQEQCVLKAARAYMVFDALEQSGEIIKSAPSVEDIEQDKFERQFSVYYVSKLDKSALEKIILNVSEVEGASITLFSLDSLKASSKPQEEAPVKAAQETVKSGDGPDSKPQAGGQAKQAVAGRTVRVDIERLDTLMNLFSELLIDRVRLEQLASEVQRNDLTETVEHMSRVSTDLQNIVLKLRMVPIESVFNRFPRMVRDLAKSLDKKIDLIVTGAETELDRTVIDEIGDPLVHLIRNSLDHGIETVDERKQVGKAETGKVNLRAFHSGNHVFIEIEDDGRGINKDKVLKIALKNGVVTQDEAKKLTDNEINMLLFASGFSTADTISDISGRGVGLDVVKTKIESLGGNVSVDSKYGSGTKFSVQLPLTLSIISAMLIKLAEEKYAVPLSSIVETLSVTSDQIRTVHGNKMVNYRSSVIPVIDLKKVLECTSKADQESDELDIVIVKKGDKMVGLIVDEFIGQQEIVLKTLGKYLTNNFATSGATILGDGQVALIIDPNALIK
jgi:two-component system chemotaxis sensor kinase CheA